MKALIEGMALRAYLPVTMAALAEKPLRTQSATTIEGCDCDGDCGQGDCDCSSDCNGDGD